MKKKLFWGEVMECKECGKTHLSDPKKESNWTAVQMDDVVFYICPKCWDEIMAGKRSPKKWTGG
jgi:DNA-directed RNA polymerase subunit RPC12/RpoP